MTTSASAPELIGAPPPPVRRDPMVLSWLAALGISWFGDYAWSVALAWTAVHAFSPAVAGLVLGAQMVPQAVLVLLGGVLADRHDPRVLLVGGQVAQAAVLGLGALAWGSGQHGPGVLLAVAVCFGAASGLTMPAGTILVREVVASDDLGTVQGWNQISTRLMKLLGAPVGGVLVAAGGPVPVMLLDAASFLISATVLTVVVRPRFRIPRTTHAGWRESFHEGISYLRRDEVARLFVVGLTALNVFVTPVTGLGVALRVSGAHWGAGWVGVADGALAVGAIVGSVVAIHRRPTYGAAAAFRLLVVQGVAIAAVGLEWKVTLVAAMAVLGFTAGAASVWLSAAFLRIVDASHLGRVSSVTSLGDMVLTPLSVPALGLLAAHTSVLTATSVCGLSMSALCCWFAARRTLRRLVC